jgi:hypothetical protein
MTAEQAIILGLALGLGIAGAVYARWSEKRLERDDPARRGPAE